MSLIQQPSLYLIQAILPEKKDHKMNLSGGDQDWLTQALWGPERNETPNVIYSDIT